ncbi:MAG: hypothetical protein WBC74_04775 [Candidatus Omnitrophota bacterium]
MKRVLALFLVALFLVSVAGCAPKSEYDKLLSEKSAIQKKCDELSSHKVRLENLVASKEKETKKLGEDLKKARTRANALEKELAKQKAKIKSLER